MPAIGLGLLLCLIQQLVKSRLHCPHRRRTNVTAPGSNSHCRTIYVSLYTRGKSNKYMHSQNGTDRPALFITVSRAPVVNLPQQVNPYRPPRCGRKNADPIFEFLGPPASRNSSQTAHIGPLRSPPFSHRNSISTWFFLHTYIPPSAPSLSVGMKLPALQCPAREI